MTSCKTLATNSTFHARVRTVRRSGAAARLHRVATFQTRSTVQFQLAALMACMASAKDVKHKTAHSTMLYHSSIWHRLLCNQGCAVHVRALTFDESLTA